MINHRLAQFTTIALISATLSGCFPVIVAGTATGVSVIHDRRSSGTVIDDQSIELKVASRLSSESYIGDSHITTTSYNQNVLMLGQVPSAQAKRAVTDLVSRVPKVNKVYNELTVGPSTSLSRRSKDSWITSKIKTSMLTNKDLDPTRVKVVTEDGVVYLMGIVTHDEAETATNIAKTTSGVKRITRLFEYISSAEANADNGDPDQNF